MAESEDKKKVVYVAVPRKWVIACITVIIVMFVGILSSFQYANWVAHQLCGVINITVDAQKANPRPTETGKTLLREFQRLGRKYHC